MPAGRSACASCAPSSTWWRATGTSARERLGILGGTFNPPHVGHLICAQEALWQLALDRVLLIPASVPPHKEVADDPGGEVRLALCEAAVGGDERLSVSRLELDRRGPSYTVDTLRAINASAPGDDLTFIVGGDMAASLPQWREPAALLGLATLGIAERAETGRAQIEQRLAGLRGAPERLRFFSMPRVDVSSTDIRERVRAGRPIRYLVPDGVERLIRARGLYPAREASGAESAVTATAGRARASSDGGPS